jgi:hypothetical protein
MDDGGCCENEERRKEENRGIDLSREGKGRRSLLCSERREP